MPNDDALELPSDLHYDAASHLWVRRDPVSGRARVGVDAMGLDALGELAYVGLVELGQEVERGAGLGTLEAAKMTSAIAAPVGGEVVARNEAALADPGRVNTDPYGEGWLVELMPSSWEKDCAQLISGDAIAPWAAAERARLDEEPTDAR